MASAKEIIAKRAAQELKDGDVVNLGIGLPTMVANYVPSNVHIVLQSENGILGMGEMAQPGEEDKDIINSGFQYVHVNSGASFFDSATSFGIIRGGHVDVTILGALQVDETGTLASHIVPGQDGFRHGRRDGPGRGLEKGHRRDHPTPNNGSPPKLLKKRSAARNRARTR